MSAIWGMISINKQEIDSSKVNMMQIPYQSCVIDTYNQIVENHFILGSGLRKITPEDEFEHLPIYDQPSGIYLTADVYLDNREELSHELGYRNHSIIPDSRFILDSYKKWGNDCVSHLYGAFSFVIYDTEKNTILCATDALSTRILYYTLWDNVLYFSTLIRPIIDVLPKKPEVNERWVTDFLAVDNLAITSECIETPYAGINKICPGQCIVIKDGIVEKYDYWDPFADKKPVSRLTDEEYKILFRNIFDKAVSRCLRTNYETGILLSSGLDSTSVACIAAPILKESNKSLFSFTSIPESDYQSTLDERYNPNEKSLVEDTCKFLGNLVPHFLRFEGWNAWDYTNEFISISEIPYKALQNSMWITECARAAANEGCRIMLNGQYGNATLSYGDILTYYLTLLKHFHWKTFFHDVNIAQKKYRYSRKQIISCVVKEWQAYSFLCHPSYTFHKFENVLVNSKLLKKHHVVHRFRKLRINNPYYRPNLMDDKHYMYHKTALSQIGEMETKMSLYTGVLFRDPTRDRDLITLCIQLPFEQYTRYCSDRLLVKDYLRDALPPAILNVHNKKGLQSADFIHRINKNRERVFQEVNTLLESKEAKQYLNLDKCRKAITILMNPIQEENRFDLSRTLYTMLLVKFLQSC